MQQQAYIPITFNSTGGAPIGIPNVSGTAESYLDLAQAAARDGRLEISEYLLDKAVEAESAGTAEAHLPGMPPFGSLRDLSEPIVKSVAQNALSANPTPVRYNESMELMGFYNGIKSPEDINARSFQFLEMCSRNPIIEAAISTRVKQAMSFAKFRPDGRGRGFTIRMKSSTASLSRAARKRIDEISSIVENGGVLYRNSGERRVNPRTGEPGVWDGNNEEKALSFPQVIAKMVRYSITYDFAPLRFESGRDSKRYPLMFYTPVDPVWVRPTTSAYRPQIDKRLKTVQYVEMNPTNPTQVVREFDWQLMQVMITNPEISRINRGFGTSPLEFLVDLIASAVLGLNFTRSYFNDSHVPPGIVTFKGQATPMGTQTREYLKQQIQQGASSRSPHKLMYLTFPPNIQGDPISLLPLRSQLGTAQEMGWIKEWYAQIVAMICAVLTISPEEIGWTGVSNVKSILSEPSRESEFKESKEKGLVPLLASLSDFFQESIVERIDPDFVFEWCGLEADELDNPEKIQELMGQGYTPNQILDMRDMPRMKPPLLPEIREEVASKMSVDDFDTRVEYEDAVDDEYARIVLEMGKKPFSDYPNMPIGNPAALQIMQMELQQNQSGGGPDEGEDEGGGQEWPPDENEDGQPDEGEENIENETGEDGDAENIDSSEQYQRRSGGFFNQERDHG